MLSNLGVFLCQELCSSLDTGGEGVMKHDNALNTVLEKGKCLLLSVFM